MIAAAIWGQEIKAARFEFFLPSANDACPAPLIHSMSAIEFPERSSPRHRIDRQDAGILGTMSCGNELVHPGCDRRQRRHRPAA